MSQDDPYAAIAAPIAQDDPYAQIAAPVTVQHLKVATRKGKMVDFDAPIDADDTKIRALASKASGRPTAEITVSRPKIDKANGVELPPEDSDSGLTLADLVAGRKLAPARSAADSLGLGTRGVMTGLGGLLDIPGGAVNSLINLTGTKLSTTPFRDAANGVANYVGLPTPETNTEQLTNSIVEGGTSALLPAALATRGGAMLAPLATRPLSQLAAGAASGAAAEETRQLGGGPVAQFAAGLGVGALPFAAGTAAERAATGVRAWADPTRYAPKVTPRAGEIVLSRLAAQGQTPAMAGQMLDAAHARGVPLAIMDIGDETRGLASALSRKPGPSRTIIRDVVIPRQSAQGDRVTGAVNRDLGPTANIRQQSEDLIKGARREAAPLYDEAYATPVPVTPEMESLLSTPFGRQALARAKTIAANERRSPDELGFALDDAGNVSLNPHPSAKSARLLAARDQLDEAQAALRDMRKTPGSDVAAARGKVESARERLRKAEAAIGNAPDPAAPASVRAYTTQTLDYVKRGMDDVIESMRDPVTGRLVLDEAGRAMKGVRSNFLKEMDTLNPAYGKARAAYAGPASMASALAKGAKVATRDADTIAAETANLSGPELEQYKLGVRTALVKMLEGKVDGSDKVAALINTPRKRAALAQLFGGEENFGRLIDTLADEGLAAQTYGRVNTGSTTAGNLADDAELGAIGDAAVNAGARAIGGVGIGRNAISTIADLYRYGAGKSGERVRAELAAGISETDPVALKDAITAAIKANSRRGLKKNSRRAAIASSATASQARDH